MTSGPTSIPDDDLGSSLDYVTIDDLAAFGITPADVRRRCLGAVALNGGDTYSAIDLAPLWAVEVTDDKPDQHERRHHEPSKSDRKNR